jgi:hypothetical protein
MVATACTEVHLFSRRDCGRWCAAILPRLRRKMHWRSLKTNSLKPHNNLFPSFQNIRCFRFIKEMYLDIF